mmetsp:Transcript_26395/g.76168  ORF Transcript_26395/g.76168 Transcript_26395/m.76168 type:complete len:312 (+) Transcript_26395:666-1601(+)
MLLRLRLRLRLPSLPPALPMHSTNPGRQVQGRGSAPSPRRWTLPPPSSRRNLWRPVGRLAGGGTNLARRAASHRSREMRSIIPRPRRAPADGCVPAGGFRPVLARRAAGAVGTNESSRAMGGTPTRTSRLVLPLARHPIRLQPQQQASTTMRQPIRLRQRGSSSPRWPGRRPWRPPSSPRPSASTGTGRTRIPITTPSSPGRGPSPRPYRPGRPPSRACPTRMLWSTSTSRPTSPARLPAWAVGPQATPATGASASPSSRSSLPWWPAPTTGPTPSSPTARPPPSPSTPSPALEAAVWRPRHPSTSAVPMP